MWWAVLKFKDNDDEDYRPNETTFTNNAAMQIAKKIAMLMAILW